MYKEFDKEETLMMIPKDFESHIYSLIGIDLAEVIEEHPDPEKDTIIVGMLETQLKFDGDNKTYNIHIDYASQVRLSNPAGVYLPITILLMGVSSEGDIIPEYVYTRYNKWKEENPDYNIILKTIKR